MTRRRVQPVVSRRSSPTTGWAGVQRRVRRLVPAPLRRADLALFRAVARTQIPIIGPALPRLSTAANHSRLWMGIAALMAGFGGRFGRRAAVRGLLAIGVTSTVTNLPAKLATGRLRPDLDIVPEIRRLARVPTSTSFPSGHSASAFAFATAAALEEPRLRWPLMTLAGAVATSRVYTGVHYPGDAIVGSAIGVAVAGATTGWWPLIDPTPAIAAPPDGEQARPDPDGTGLVMVANVGAGSAFDDRRLARFREALPGARILEAEPYEDLTASLERAAADARVLGVAGGDGSVSAAAAVARARGVPLAIMPTGTLNNFAKDLGVPDDAAAVAAIRHGRAVAVDVGDVDGRVFVNQTSLGAYPHQVAIREGLEDRIGKWPAAFWSTLRTLATDDPVEVEIDGHRRLVWLLFIGNGSFRSDGTAPSRRDRLDDGSLDIRIVHAERPWSRTRVIASVLAGRLPHSPAYERWTAPEVRIRSLEGSLRVATDGEIWRHDTADFTVRKHPRSLVVIQPPPGRDRAAR